jgi:excisionase family DNA binding protein
MNRTATRTASPPSQAAESGILGEKLATAEEIAKPINVTSRTILAWAAAGTIPVALRQGRIVRFSPSAVARALGL